MLRWSLPWWHPVCRACRNSCSDTQKAQRETAEVLEAAEQLESEHLTLKEDAHLRAAWEKAELTSELEELRQENQALESHSSQCFGEGAGVPAACQCTFAATPAGGRALSLKHLKDAIEEIYVSKVSARKDNCPGKRWSSTCTRSLQEVRTEGKC